MRKIKCISCGKIILFKRKLIDKEFCNECYVQEAGITWNGMYNDLDEYEE